MQINTDSQKQKNRLPVRGGGSGGFISYSRIAQIGPINVRAQRFATNHSARFSIDVDTQIFTGAAITPGYLHQMPDSGTTTPGKIRLVRSRQLLYILQEIHKTLQSEGRTLAIANVFGNS